MSKLSTVYHVGRLDQSKRSGSFSYEGSGLSVSLHPDAWRRIARGQVSGDTWVLKKAKPKFLLATKTNKEKAVEWAVKNDWLKEATRYRVSWFDAEMDDTVSMEFDSLEEAQVEAEDRGVEPEAVKSYVLAKKGIDYWRQAFQSEPDNSMAAEFAILWLAEERGYDGVWWNDKIDLVQLSAPRGVIFQSKLGEWSKQKVDGEASVRGSASRLYRRVTDDHYTGAGSFWSDDPLVAEKYGPRGGQTISTELSGRVLVVDSDIELEAKLVGLGIENAAELLRESEWHEDEDVLKALRDAGYVWVSRPVDPSVPRTEREFIRVAEGSALKAASALEDIYYRTADGRAHVLIGNAASFADEEGAAAELKYESGLVAYVSDIESLGLAKGQGTRLMQHVLTDLRKRGVLTVALQPIGYTRRGGTFDYIEYGDTGHDRLVRFYEKFGFKLRTGDQPFNNPLMYLSLGATVSAVHYTDIYPAGFTAFRKKYLPLLKQSDHRYLYVQFTNFAADSLSRNPHKDTDHHDPIGVYGYPLAYVLKHPADIWYGSKAKFLRVLRERKRNKTLFLQGLSHSEASSILWKMGLDSNDMDKAKLLWPDRIGNTKNSVAKAMFTVIQMDLSSVVVPRNKDRRREVAKGVRIRSGVEQTALLRKAGFDAVEDTAGTNKGAVINDREPEQIIFLHRHAFDVVETVQLRGDVNSRGVGTTQELGIVALKLAVLLAQAMNDRIVDKEVNYSGVQVWTAGGREIQVSLDRPDSYYKNKKMGEKKHKESKLASPYMVKTTVTTERGVFHPGRGYTSIPFQEIADEFARSFEAADPVEGFVPVTRAKREAEKKAAEAAWRAKERSKEDQERERYAPGWLASIAEASAMLGVPFQHADLWNKDAESRKALQTVMRVVGRGFSGAYTLAKRAANEQNDWKWSNYFDKDRAEQALDSTRQLSSEGYIEADPAALEELLALYKSALDWMLSEGTWNYQHPDAFWSFIVRDLAEKQDA